MKRVTAVVLVLGLLAATGAGCGGDQTAEGMLALDFWAFDHLALAVVTPDSMPDRFPHSFNALAAGTRAFIAGDMEGVRTSIEEIRAMPVLAPRDSMFLWSLEFLETKEGKTLREAEEAMPE